ncbi:PTS transporter subunit EIIB [Clostridium sp.]|jgi:phosphotransferase system IIB component|uniref:PTS transporter subunit EIIB n=1 Tax=Clostridium sp. TaxID=1506 RepID=UPI002848862B|nr:PTS transporter subunit EIIB [Clostridium sp.]MDR3593519.1 PTS transporter subunit EIIB [Clostridium sp.]
MRSELTKSAEDIFGFLGYAENILSIGKCSTRLRLNLVDKKIVDISQFKKVDGVLGVVETREQLQIIMQPKKAKSLINEFIKIYKIKKTN